MGGAPPPFPGHNACGPDLTDGVVLKLDCDQYNACTQTDSDGDGLTNHSETTHFGSNINLVDSDGDNFADGEEVLPTGVAGCNGTRLNIRNIGALPTRIDIYVEIDWMSDVNHDHLPNAMGLQRVVDAFNNRNMSLHLDTGVAPFDLDGGGPIPHQEPLQQPGQTIFQSFEDLKATHFNEARCNVFHYNIWAHTQDGGGVSGLSQGIFTDDFIVSLGDPFWGANNWPDQATLQGGTFMHELGHNLNLRHGGNENLNLKPHYRSVMTHRYQVEGRDVDCQIGGDAVLDYSDEVLANLLETQLSETNGMCNGVDVNWNLNGVIDGGLVQANINCSARPDLFGPCSQSPALISAVPQTGFDDWGGGIMRFDFQNSPNRQFGGAGGGGEIPDELICLSAP